MSVYKNLIEKENIVFKKKPGIKTFLDLESMKIGILSVLGYAGTSRWYCQCECGNYCIRSYSALTKAVSKSFIISCGCTYKSPRKVHGMCTSRIYNIRINMIDRCYNTSATIYSYYGGRGITVCDEWVDKENGFMNFYNWAMSSGYTDELTIDRINVNGNYEPSNCRWFTMKQQSNNKRSNIIFYVNGKSITTTEVSIKNNISLGTIYRRIKDGWSDEDIVNTQKNKRYKYKNK